MDKLKTWIEIALTRSGEELDAHKQAQVEKYLNFLLETNRSLNLTAITEVQEVAERHLQDSWSILPILDAESKRLGRPLSLADIGTGAGFPGLPVKICRPETDLLLLDSLGKRVRFLESACEQIELQKPWRCVHARAEDGARAADLREHFDLVTARAVAELRVLVEYCLPFVKLGGLFIAMKSDVSAEISEAAQAIQLLGGQLEAVLEPEIKGTDLKRSLILVRKVKACPKRFPRKAGTAKSEPL